MKRLIRAYALHTLLLLGWSAVAVACSDECDENQNALPRTDFRYSSDPGETVQTTGMEIFGIGAPNDSILWTGTQSASELYLPFRIDTDNTRYVFRLRPESDQETAGTETPADTVTFLYSRTPRLVSAACGVSYLFTVNGISWTGELIDSVVCPDGYIDNRAIVNLHVYLRPGIFE